MAEGHEERPRKSLLGWLKDVWDEAGETARERVEEAARSEERPEAVALPEAAPRRVTRPVGRAHGTAPIRTTPEEEEGESRKRLGFILAYMKDPTSDPNFANKPLVYRILADERSFQQRRIVSLRTKIKALPPPAEAMGLSPDEVAAHPVYAEAEANRKAYHAALEEALKYQGYIFDLMKSLTGVRGKTGGTDFLG